MTTKYCAKCGKATTGIKVEKKTWLCWECFQKFYSQQQEIEVNIKDIEVKHKKAVKEFLKK